MSAASLAARGKDEIAGEHRGGGRPLGVQGGVAAPQESAIDQVIVHQCGGVEHLDCGRKGDQPIRFAAQHAAGEQRHGRSHTLAPGSEQMLQRAVQAGVPIFHLGAHERLDLGHDGLDGLKKVQRF